MLASKTYEISSKIREKQAEIVQQDLLIEEIEKKKREIRNEIVQLNCRLNGLPNGINALPEEVLCFIWENFLDFQNLLKCKRVCVRWFHAIRSLMKSLVIFDRHQRQELNSLKGQRWFYSGRLINSNLSVPVQKIRFDSSLSSCPSDPLNPPFRSKFLLKLRRLHLVASVDRPLWCLFGFINRLEGLEELEFSDLWTESERPIQFWIRCPNLKSLFIGQTSATVTVVVESKIAKLKTHCHLASLRFDYPGELREIHLVTEYRQALYDKVRFSNLEVFTCANAIDDESLEQLIEHSVGLKELHLGLSSDLTHYESVKTNALKALHSKNVFNRSELNIVFYGVKLENEEQLSGFSFDSGDHGRLIKLLTKNYTKLADDLAWLERISYKHLSESVVGELPRDFHLKFNIKELLVHGSVKNQAHLLDFLRSCKKLRSLTIENSSLDELFYSKIDFSPIKSLKISETANKISDFSFILQLKELECFQANLQIPAHLIRRGVDYLKSMVRIESNQSKSIKIEKNSVGFELTIDGNSIHRKTYTASQLVEILAKL